MNFEDTTLLQKFILIIKLAIPSVLCLVVFGLQQLINLYFAGHLGDSAIIAAIGLGNLIQNCSVEVLIWGLNSSLEQLVS
jgi:Na+-driven multidrug efflux pump